MRLALVLCLLARDVYSPIDSKKNIFGKLATSSILSKLTVQIKNELSMS